MSADGLGLLAVGLVPKADGVIGAAGDQHLAVAADGDGGHAAGVPGELAFGLIVGQVGFGNPRRRGYDSSIDELTSS